MRFRSVLLTAALPLAFGSLAGPAAAQVAGEEEGVTHVRRGSDSVLRFSKRAAPVYRRIAGRRVEIGCGRVSRDGGGYSSDGETTTKYRAPKRRQALRTFTGGRTDYCLIRLAGRGEVLVVMTPASKAGRIYLDELRTAGSLFLPFAFADAEDDYTPPSTEELVASGKGFVVALDGPEGTPPREKVGYWSDGRRAVVAAVTERGRRLFYETEGDVVRTNVLGYLMED